MIGDDVYFIINAVINYDIVNKQHHLMLSNDVILVMILGYQYYVKSMLCQIVLIMIKLRY